MRTYFQSLCIFLFLAQHLSAQSNEARFLIDTCLSIMKSNAVNRDQVNWPLVEASAQSRITTVGNAYQMGPVIRYLFRSINDYHGSLSYKDSSFRWQDKLVQFSDSITNEWKKGAKIKTAILNGDIGYLRIPSMPFAGREDADKKAQSLNDSLCLLLDRHVRGVILDLRLDGGGAMYPMILGVKQLISEGRVGSFIGKEGQSWYLRGNDFMLDTQIMTSLVHSCNLNAQDLPVAILIGPGTGSSGEFFLIALRARKNTFFIGTPTAGYVTAVRGFPINNATWLFLAVGYGADANGKIYTQAITPDLLISATDSFNDLDEDLKVKAAISWIQAH